jgi:hypothetical protein
MSYASVGQSHDTLSNEEVVSDIPQPTTQETLSTFVLRRNGRIIGALDRFMFLGEPYEAIPEGLESEPQTYEKEINDVDTDR